MRLIDADEIGLTDFEIVMCNGDYKEALKMLIDKISNQPTAYSVDKVVDELEETKETSLELVKLPKFLKKDLQELVNMCFDEAIEIVKQGGVDDDVCEWRKHSICGFYSAHEGAVSIINIADGYKHCPYCGKKIKVVE